MILHGKEGQQMIVVGKGRLGAAVMIEDEIVQVKVEYIRVALVHASTCGG